MNYPRSNEIRKDLVFRKVRNVNMPRTQAHCPYVKIGMHYLEMVQMATTSLVKGFRISIDKIGKKIALFRKSKASEIS